MATQDSSPGLLSKMARFVRNPTKDWAALDKPQEPQDIDHGKEALKLVIERKRHDDAVRRREFSQLRKLRQASPSIKAELAQDRSMFATTTGDSNMDERATTLKKIDEIEAQMSRQWWKSRSGFTPVALAVPSDNAPESADPDEFASTQASRLLLTAPNDTPESFDFQSTKPGGAARQGAGEAFRMSSHSALSSSWMTVVDQSPYLSDPDMEEAAIRFANSDDAGAEATLQAAWQQPDAKPELAQGWAAALFGLYRSTGQTDRFERLALDYAHRFGRSAPAWSIVPQSAQAFSPVPSSPGETSPAVASAGPHWVCPVAFDDLAVVQLRDLVGLSTVIHCLDWSPLQRMSASAAKRLAELLARWCEAPLTFAFEGVAPLVDLLQAYTPSGDRLVPAFFWQLRFDALRLLRRHDDYELAALDYCVTFEVSPPPWRIPNGLRVDWPQDPATLFASDPGVAPEDALPAVLAQSLVPEQARQLVLSGEVIGDVSGIVDRWQLADGDDGFWMVSCAHLIRVDFSAAGGLLNWVAHMATEGKRVEFREVPHLVAAFFNLIGINEHAQVTVRIN